MPDSLRITRIFLSGPDPFNDCEIDLTDPETGAPLDAVCLFGLNGTGKAMLLRQLRCSAEFRSPRLDSELWSDSLVITEFLHNERRVFQARPGSFDEQAGAKVLWLNDSLETQDREPSGYAEFHERSSYLQIAENDHPEQPRISAFSVAESSSSEQLADFLAGIARSREEDFSRTLRLRENREKSVSEIETEFNRVHRDLFQELGAFWSRTIPGLAAELATDGDFMSKLARFEPGIRSLLLRTGSLLRDRSEDAFRLLFLDCPECGLDPITAMQALDIYRTALGGKGHQIFTTTDSPLIAAQFDPASRIRLERGENGIVSAARGEAPVGADATQMLKRDFGMPGKGANESRKPHGGYMEDYELDEDDLADMIDATSWRRKS